MWTLAKADLAVSPEELDTDPMLLNVENGTVDLRTGSLRPHLPEDLITKLAPVEFDPVAEASRFMKFLKQTLVDAELIAFVQRFLGYSLTGSTKERALSVLHGVGKNGKSTLVEVFQDLMGDYSTTTNHGSGGSSLAALTTSSTPQCRQGLRARRGLQSRSSRLTILSGIRQ